MPSADEILKGLTLLSNKYIAVAIAWHELILLFMLFHLSAKGKVTNQFAPLIVFLPLLSVSMFAWMAGNPFNGVVFLIASVLLFALGGPKKESLIWREPKTWSKIAGSLIFLSGFFYPHFLGGNWWTYLYGAPVGLVPCPTLLVVSGLLLMLPSSQSPSRILVLAFLDAFYGLFGIFKLNVYWDVILIAATIVLTLQTGLIKLHREGATIQTLPTGNRA